MSGHSSRRRLSPRGEQVREPHPDETVSRTPTPGAARDLLSLQRTAGNQAVVRLLAERSRSIARVRTPADETAAEQAHEKARQELDADRHKLRSALETGKSQKDTLVANSIEWIEKGTLGALLYAVRRTGDSKERAPNDQAAFFPKASDGVTAGHLGDPLPSYNWRDLDDNANVHFETPRAGGWNADGRQIAIEVGTAGPEELWRRIKHEVQHAADRHQDVLQRIVVAHERAQVLTGVATAMSTRGEALMHEGMPRLQILDLEGGEGALERPEPEADQRRKAAAMETGSEFSSAADVLADAVRLMNEEALAERALEKFKTEYRAYWYMSDPEFDRLRPDFGPFAPLYTQGIEVDDLEWTPRQAAIVGQIVDGYPEVKRAYNRDARLKSGQRFKKAINEYRLPDAEGYNKLNSVRVNRVYEALRGIPPKTAAAADVRALLDAVAELQPAEAAYVSSSTEAAAMNRLMNERLTGPALDAVRKALTGRAPAPSRSFWPF